MSELKAIPAKFRKNSYDYTLIAREDDVAIYDQGRKGKTYAFEVVKIGKRAAREVGGRQYPAQEKLPADSDWGLRGKTYSAYLYGAMAARRLADDRMRVWVAEMAQKRLAA